jgi:Ca2+-binding EF-hand superfamily protein
VEFRAAWNTHFKVEAMCEGIRQRLRSLPCFDLYSAFLTCDLYHDGVISRDELRRLIDCRGFYVTETDAKQLVDKMDKDRDGVVSYCEFREELEPKSFSFYRA